MGMKQIIALGFGIGALLGGASMGAYVLLVLRQERLEQERVKGLVLRREERLWRETAGRAGSPPTLAPSARVVRAAERT